MDKEESYKSVIGGEDKLTDTGSLTLAHPRTGSLLTLSALPPGPLVC
jgi:hypothetical protein